MGTILAQGQLVHFRLSFTSMALLAYVACRLGALYLFGGVSSLLWSGRWTMGCLGGECWRPPGRLPGDGSYPTSCNGGCQRGSPSSKRGPLDGDAGRTTGASLQTGEKSLACQKWARSDSLGGPRPLEPNWRSDATNNLHTRFREYLTTSGGAQDEVCFSLGPSGRDGVRDCPRDPTASMSGDLHQKGGRSS